MRTSAGAGAEDCGVPFVLFDRLDRPRGQRRADFLLADFSGMPVPAKYRRQRSQLQDAMLDGHFFFGGKKVAIGAEPDLLWTLGMLLTEMGCEIGSRGHHHGIAGAGAHFRSRRS